VTALIHLGGSATRPLKNVSENEASLTVEKATARFLRAV